MSRRHWSCSLLVALSCIFTARSGLAHEFWIDPLDFTVAEDQTIEANNRVGQMMKGDVYPYISSTFVEYSITDPDGKREVKGALGSRPALKIDARRSGLHVVGFQSVPSGTRYKTAEKFEGFLRKEGIEWVLDAHRERKLPDAGFKEAFTRFAKSLIAVGDGTGSDAPLGFRFEIIAETNPYVEDGPMIVQLLFEGQPHPEAQLTIFRRDGNGAVTRGTMQTDAEGRATVPIAAGSTYLLNAVQMVEPDGELALKKDVVWHSLWASLTYQVE